MNLRNKLNLLMLSQAKKKKEPIWCEYLESTGTQYIDTGLRLNQDSRISATYLAVVGSSSSDTEFATVLGCTDSPEVFSANNGCIRLIGSLNRVGFGNTRDGTNHDIHTYNSLNVKYRIELYAGNCTLTDLEDNTINNFLLENNGEPWTSKYTLTLFGRNSGKQSADYLFTGRFYSIQIYNGNNLIMNLRPCLHPETLRPAMYDTVEGKYYYNEGTGEFKYKLSFTKLDYIESTGVQYIDTGFTQKQNIKIVTDLEFTKKTADRDWEGWYCVVGSRIGDGRFNMIGNAKNAFHVAIGTDNTYGKTELNTKYHTETTVYTDSFDLSVDGTYLAWRVPVTVPINEQSLYILGTHRQEVTPGEQELSKNLAFVKLYDALLYADNILARDYIPVRMNDGQIGLWDYVEGKFYPNLGAEKLKGYLNGYQVGESIHSNGNQYIDTGFTPNELTTQGALFQAVIAEQPRNVGVFGCYNTSITNARFQALLLKTNKSYNIGYGSQGHDMYPQTDESLLNVAVIDGKNKKIIFNETEIDIAGAEGSLNSNNYNSYLFSVIQTGVNLMSISSIYYSWIEDNGKLIRNFIPVQKGNFIGMVDTLTMKEYRNLGSGGFTFNA